MARHTSRHAARRTWLGGFAVCLIVAFSGYLLVTNVRVNRTATVTSDTADLVEQRVEHVDQLQKDITDLSAQINTLKDFANNSGSSEQPSGTSDPKPSDTEDAGSGTILPAVHGPGITVTLNDSRCGRTWWTARARPRTSTITSCIRRMWRLLSTPCGRAARSR